MRLHQSYTQKICQLAHIMRRHILACFLPLTASGSLMSQQFIINAIVILLMYHLISIYRFLHLTSGQFGNTKTQIQCVYSVQFHWWIEMTSLVTKRQMKKLKVSTTSYKICSKIFFLTRFPKPTIITGWILRLFYPWEIGLNWRRDITLIQLNRIKIFSSLNQTSAQTWSLRPNNGTQIN